LRTAYLLGKISYFSNGILLSSRHALIAENIFLLEEN